MASFADILKQNADENTEEKRIERMKKKILNNLYEKIKGECVDCSNHGCTSCETLISSFLENSIEECVGSYANYLFFHHPGEPHSENIKALSDPEFIKQFIENKLTEDGLKFELIKECTINKYRMEERIVENSTAVKAASIGLNFLLGADLDVDQTVKRKAIKIGTEISDLRYRIHWD